MSQDPAPVKKATFDLNDPPPGHSVKGSFQVDVEEHPHERGVRLFKDVAVFVVSLLGAIAIAYFCVTVVLDVESAPLAKQVASGFLGAIGGTMATILSRK